MSQVKNTVNHVELLGWLGGDPELRMLPNGVAVCRLSIATKRYGPSDEAGRRTFETEWINVEAWDKLAELCNSYLHKGSRVRVTGHIRTDSWTDKSTNQPRSRTFVRAENLIFLDARSGLPSEAVAAAEDTEAPVEGEEVPF
jgi:single-strand DNA-binding protein